MPGSHQSSLLNATEWVSHWQGLPIWYDSGPIKNDFHQTHGMNKMWCWKKGWTSFYRFRIKFLIFSLPISIPTGGAGWCCWWGCTAPPSSSSSSCSSCPSPTSSASTPSLGEPISYFDTNENPNIFCIKCDLKIFAANFDTNDYLNKCSDQKYFGLDWHQFCAFTIQKNDTNQNLLIYFDLTYHFPGLL